VKQVTITNCGGPGEWSASATTVDNGQWLVVSPPVGKLKSGESQPVSIVVVNQKVPGVSDVNGKVTFTLGPNKETVSVQVLTSSNGVVPICGIGVDTPYLSFVAVEGQNGQQSQQITICGIGNMDWSAVVSADDGSSWLSINPPKGQLSGRASASIEVDSTGLSNGIHQGTITFTIGSSNATASPQSTPSETPTPTFEATASVVLVVQAPTTPAPTPTP
jgi:hypothetical protein